MKIKPENLKIDLFLHRLCDTEEKADEIDNEIMEAVDRASMPSSMLFSPPEKDSYRNHTLSAVFEGSEVSVEKRCLFCGNRGHKTKLTYELVVQSNAEDGGCLHITEQDVILLKQTLSDIRGVTACEIYGFAPLGSVSGLPEEDSLSDDTYDAHGVNTKNSFNTCE